MKYAKYNRGRESSPFILETKWSKYESLVLMIDITFVKKQQRAIVFSFQMYVIPPFLSMRSCQGSYSGDNLQSTSISYLEYVVCAG